MSRDPVGTINDLLAREGVEALDPDAIRLVELDSLLVAEMMAAVEDSVGHTIWPDAFDPDTTSVGDLVRFCLQGAGRP